MLHQGLKVKGLNFSLFDIYKMYNYPCIMRSPVYNTFLDFDKKTYDLISSRE